jgi:NAD(P)-dependent dehydrogenase (short-subunit alcohol dehydrogenase family)
VDKLGGTITSIVNAAGGLRGGAVGDPYCDLANYEYNMKLNTQAPFEIITAVVPFLESCGKDNNPSIVIVSSVNGKQSFAGCASYCMSKAAVDQLTRCASVDLAKFGIRVNAVNPGVIKTNLHRVRYIGMEFWIGFNRYFSFVLTMIRTTCFSSVCRHRGWMRLPMNNFWNEASTKPIHYPLVWAGWGHQMK